MKTYTAGQLEAAFEFLRRMRTLNKGEQVMSENMRGFLLTLLVIGSMGSSLFGIKLAHNYYSEWQPYGEVCKPTEAQDQIRDIRKLLEGK